MNLEAARIQLQTTQNDDTKLAYKQLANDEAEWETFQTRNDKGKLIKIREMFSAFVSAMHQYSTRRSNDICF